MVLATTGNNVSLYCDPRDTMSYKLGVAPIHKQCGGNSQLVVRYYIIFYSDAVFAMVSPAVLVAAMKVDSSYIPSLLPTFHLSANVNQIRIDVINQYSPSTSTGAHATLLYYYSYFYSTFDLKICRKFYIIADCLWK